MQCFTRCFTHRYGTYRLKKASDRNIHYQLEHMQAKYDASSIDIHQPRLFEEPHAPSLRRLTMKCRSDILQKKPVFQESFI